MKTSWSIVLFVPAALFLVPAEILAQPGGASVAWIAQPDPSPFKLESVTAGSKEIPLGKNGGMIFPSTFSHFGVTAVPARLKAPLELKMIDLRTLEQVGPAVQTGKGDPRDIRVSPWGEAVATVDDRAGKHTIKVWAFDAGKTVQTVTATDPSDERGRLEGFDFADRGQLLTIKEIRDVPKNFFSRLFEVWDIRTGKRLSSFYFGLEEYSNRWVSLSPGRHYIVMAHNSNDGYFVFLFDLRTGKMAGRLEVQPRSDGFGIPSGFSFSPDGKELALLWWQGGPGFLAKIQRFDIEKGAKKGEHRLGSDFKPAEVGFKAGGMKAFQFLPDGRGWLISGHLIYERESGKLVRAVGSAPGYLNNVADRRFVDGYHVTTIGDKKFSDKKLSLIAYPKAELDAAYQKAAAGKN